MPDLSYSHSIINGDATILHIDFRMTTGARLIECAGTVCTATFMDKQAMTTGIHEDSRSRNLSGDPGYLRALDADASHQALLAEDERIGIILRR